jgi:hypothetical protein
VTDHLPTLCGNDGCRRLAGHQGQCNPFPGEAWSFFDGKDKKKLTKAGFATPRGGAKGAYQNHVARSSKVIIPFERFPDFDPSIYSEGYVIRLLPEQYFQADRTPKPEFVGAAATVRLGENAFVLYRTHGSFEKFPPLEGWRIRQLHLNGEEVTKRRSGVVDSGHYVLRISTADGARLKRVEGPPQGIFAPEFADPEANFLCKCVLAWLTIHARQSPYAATQATHLRAILRQADLEGVECYEFRNVLRNGLTCCPLCLKTLKYDELHKMVGFEDEAGLGNAGAQVAGSTRSTIVNLFHLEPLAYGSLEHAPRYVAWGHAVCNTRLGQRKCYSLPQLQEMDLKVAVIRDENIETFGWISEDWKMIRSPNGAVWIQLNEDTLPEEQHPQPEGAPPSTEEIVDGSVREPPQAPYGDVDVS